MSAHGCLPGGRACSASSLDLAAGVARGRLCASSTRRGPSRWLRASPAVLAAREMIEPVIRRVSPRTDCRYELTSIVSWSEISKWRPNFCHEFVLPLLHEAARGDHEAALDIAARSISSLHEQSGHDRLAGAGVVGEEEPQRLPRQHLAVYRVDLVRQRLEVRCLHGKERVEQVGQRNSLASDTSRNSAPSPSRLPTRLDPPARRSAGVHRRGREARDRPYRWLRPCTSRVIAFDPCHSASTTLTDRSANTPRTSAPFVRSSSRAIHRATPKS